jgi:TPR repeat protein
MTILAAIMQQRGDVDVALAWLEQAAQAGNLTAGTGLGLALAERGDLEQAATWLLRSAEADDVTAMTPLASVLGALDHPTQAHDWLRRAAEMGDPDALAAMRPSVAWRPASSSGTAAFPESISWTPLQHRCGCVMDWGWSSTTADPHAFMNCCIQAIDSACPAHTSPEADLPSAIIEFSAGSGGPVIYARPASGDDITLGCALAVQLRHIIGLHRSGDRDAILAEMPTAYSNWMREHHYDPVAAWTDQRVTDIALNRGQSDITYLLAQFVTGNE